MNDCPPGVVQFVEPSAEVQFTGTRALRIEAGGAQAGGLRCLNRIAVRIVTKGWHGKAGGRLGALARRLVRQADTKAGQANCWWED